MDPQKFLQDYWQKKPLLIRQAFPNFQNLVPPNALAGLACEGDVESRLIVESKGAWQLRRGPFTEKDFKKLPATNWTLLVQEVDHLLPEVAALKEHFRFIPDWRIDDVMISYAVDQGSVGPHVDNYDVFLLQGMGKRRWQVGAGPITEEALLEGCDLRVLQSFEAAETWELEPGDMLYVPPRYAHWGVSLGEGMTYSIGFRSPSCADLLVAQTNQWIAQWDDKDRFVDPDLKPQSHPAEISSDALENVVAWLKSLNPESDEVRHWFGKMVTAHPNAQEVEPTSTALTDACLIRSGDARLAFINAKDSILLFVNGEEYIFPASSREFIETLTRTYRIQAAQLEPFMTEHASFLQEMLAIGAFYYDDDSVLAKSP